MSSTEADKPTPAPEPVKAAPPPEVPALEVEKAAPPPEAPPPECKVSEAAPPPDLLVVADVVLRVLLFLAAVAAVVVMVTSKETKLVPSPFPPFQPVPQQAKFNHSPAFIYFVAALSVAGLYSIITTAVSFLALLKPGCFTKYLAHFVILDVIILGIVASATGAAGAVAYIGLKGNSHVRWTKVCNVYEKYCQHLGASVAVSLFGSVVLVLLVILSAYSLSKKIPS